MSATTTQYENLFKSAIDSHLDLDTGVKLVMNTLGALAGVTSVVLAFTASSVWVGLLIWFISAVVLTLLAAIAALYFCVRHADKVEAIGRTANNTSDAVRGAASKVRGWFSR